eukprot:scaffold4425_cov194-Alexandrium_tamarense.AAC.4
MITLNTARKAAASIIGSSTPKSTASVTEALSSQTSPSTSLSTTSLLTQHQHQQSASFSVTSATQQPSTNNHDDEPNLGVWQPNQTTTIIRRMEQTCPDVMKEYAQCVIEKQNEGALVKGACEESFGRVMDYLIRNVGGQFEVKIFCSATTDDRQCVLSGEEMENQKSVQMNPLD